VDVGSMNRPVAIIYVTNIESVARCYSSVAITYTDMNAVTIGGVSPALTGVRSITDGDVQFTAGGTITLADTDGPDIVHSGSAGGNVTMQAFGIGSDIVVAVDKPAFTSEHGGVFVTAGRDLLL